jgi:hypothetical protein
MILVIVSDLIGCAGEQLLLTAGFAALGPGALAVFRSHDPSLAAFGQPRKESMRRTDGGYLLRLKHSGVRLPGLQSEWRLALGRAYIFLEQAGTPKN